MNVIETIQSWLLRHNSLFKIGALMGIIFLDGTIFILGLSDIDESNELTSSVLFIGGLIFLLGCVLFYDWRKLVDTRVEVQSDSTYKLKANEKLITEEVTGEEIVKRTKLSKRSTFGIWGGAVRLFLIWTIVIIFIFYIKPGDLLNTINLQMIISLNIVLAYYGLKPEKVLPETFVFRGEIEKPTTKTFISNFSELNQFLKEFEESIKIQFNRLRANVNQITQEAQKFTDGVRKPIEVMRSGISNVKPPQKFQTPLDTIGVILLALLLSYIASTVETNDDLVIQIITGSTFAALAIVAGNLFQNTFFVSQKDIINGFYKTANNRLNEIEQVVDAIDTNVSNTLQVALTLIDGVEKEIEENIKELWETNFLDKLPQDLSAALTLTSVSLIFFLGIILNPGEPLYSLILWFISYYFASKK